HVREVAVPEAVALDGGAAAEKRLCTCPRLRLAHTLGPEDDPCHLDFAATCKREQRRAAADLDVVGMRAQREDAANGRVSSQEREPMHQRPSVASIPACRQGASLLSASVSSRCLSLIVSIGSQKPSYRYARSSPFSIRRLKPSTTSSSPG